MKQFKANECYKTEYNGYVYKCIRRTKKFGFFYDEKLDTVIKAKIREFHFGDRKGTECVDINHFMIWAQ